MACDMSHELQPEPKCGCCCRCSRRPTDGDDDRAWLSIDAAADDAEPRGGCARWWRMDAAISIEVRCPSAVPIGANRSTNSIVACPPPPALLVPEAEAAAAAAAAATNML